MTMTVLLGITRAVATAVEYGWPLITKDERAAEAPVPPADRGVVGGLLFSAVGEAL